MNETQSGVKRKRQTPADSQRSSQRSKPAPAPKPAASPPKKRQPSRARDTIESKRKDMKRNRFREWMHATLRAGVIAMVLFFFLWPVKVVGASMLDVYNDGDYVFMSRIAAYFRSVKRGDIVLCSASQQIGEHNVIKRVIGVGGDRITIKDGVIYVNGEIIEEAYAKGATEGETDIILARDEYFLLGDNRAVSRDSREFGAVKRSEIAGKILFRAPFRA